MTTWLLATVGKRGYIADWLREAHSRIGDSVRIVGCGTDSLTPGFAACDVSERVPGYTTPEYEAAVLDLVERWRVDAMLSFADPDVARLSTFRTALADRGVRCFFPGSRAAAATFDKMRTFKVATDLGIPVPRTALTREEVSHPLVMKPRTGSASSGVHFLSAPSDTAPPTQDEVIFQEAVDGVEINVEVLCDLDGRVVRTSAWRKLQSRHGETELAITIDAPAAIEASIQLAHALPLIGPADFDWIVRDDQPHLIEINARFGGGYPVSHLAGAGFIDALAQLSLDCPVTPERTYESDIFMMKQLQPIGGRLAQAGEILHWSKSLQNSEDLA